MEKLNQKIKELKKAAEDNNLKVSDDCLFREACTFIRGELINNKESKDEPITDGQEKFIRKHKEKLKERGFDVENIQTKKQAMAIIKEYTKDWKKK